MSTPTAFSFGTGRRKTAVARVRLLPHNRLGTQMLRKLNVYAGNEHPHQAQKPEPLA